MSDFAERWATDLRSWGIPEHILSTAPQSPWIHPVSSFTPQGDLHVETPSRHRALDVLDGPSNATVLDVGCGGGRAAYGLVPPATKVVGVDHQQGMLDVFSAQATEREVQCVTVLGNWPAVEHDTPNADVVVCHHVVYNVADLVPFIHSLTTHAQRRVVLELPMRHPLSHLSDAWKHFWDLERPTTPTAYDALNLVRSTGVDAHIAEFETEPEPVRMGDLDVEHMRIRLCLTEDRDAEVRAFLAARQPIARELATIWWDI